MSIGLPHLHDAAILHHLLLHEHGRRDDAIMDGTRSGGRRLGLYESAGTIVSRKELGRNGIKVGNGGTVVFRRHLTRGQ
jgi:hypothetical protein